VWGSYSYARESSTHQTEGIPTGLVIANPWRVGGSCSCDLFTVLEANSPQLAGQT